MSKSETRVVVRYLASSRSPKGSRIRWKTKYPMDMDEGREVEWPKIKDYARDETDYDAHGAITTMEYVDRRRPSRSVTFEYFPWGGHPNSWEFYVGTKKEKGTWKTLKDLPKVIERMEKALEKYEADLSSHLEKQFKSLAGPGWNFEWDDMMDEITYTLEDEHGESYLDVSLQDVSDVVESHGASRYTLRYTAGSDYQGSFGVVNKSGKWRSTNDVKAILREAQKLWDEKKADD